MKATKLALLLLAGTSLICNAQDLRRTDAAKSACGPFDGAGESASSLPEPNGSATAKVYVIQIANFVGSCFENCGLKSRIGLDGAWVGNTVRNSFVEVNVKPGAHHLCASWDVREKHLAGLVALHSLQAEAGQTYYFGLDMMGFVSPGGSVLYTVRPLDVDEAKMLLSAYPASTQEKK